MRNVSITPLSPPAPSLAVPPGHIGPLTIPGSGRRVWWTGRVAIGLRHEPKPQHPLAVAHSHLGTPGLTLDGGV